ncbi:MAG TPA: hypothetical protein VGO57_14125 [Verrucomicrobiae bacterium]
MLSMPYRHGKTELSVKKFVAWCLGKFPEKSGIVITHTDRLASDHGRAVRDLVTSAPHRLAFPDEPGQLRGDSQAMDRLQTNAGGVWMFVGRGTMGGGYGADWILIDDFFKSDEEARSETVRDAAYHTLIKDCYSRLNEESGGILLIGTRRHADDPQGRLLDTDNPHFDPVERAKWEVIVLPALAEANDPLGRALDEPLWPERFSFEFWDNQRKSRNELVREDFQVQGQCQPTPTEGKYFKKHWLDAAEYSRADLPRNPVTGDYLLRFYGASDHAYRTGQENDRNCLLVVGVDPAGTIWVMPETWWERAATDVMTEKMIDLMLQYKPFAWFAARDAISGSIKPFLLKRMQERKCYAVLDDSLREDEDLQRRAQSIRNRIAMGMVRFPRGDWWGEAKKELLSFPNAAHDDFVAALAMLGMALDTMITAEGAPKKELPKPGTFAWHTFGQSKPGTEERKGWA